ncbi:uncharacterized protein LOC102808737, partial [Saccoglossus kowalevskii]
MSSTQANESFHNTVASKAPKNRHYSKSESLNIRIAAAVSQKNSGYTYVCSVNKENGLSPGIVSQVRGIKLDNKARKRKMQTENKKYKLRRIQLKEERNKKCNATELREGDTYNTNIAIRNDIDITCIPEPVNAPVSFPVKILQDSPVVVFDLETTSFGIDSSICQIAASYDGKIFDEYVDPCQPIHPAASNVTGLTYTCGKLFHNFNLVPTLSQKDALESFIEWIPLNSVLVAHNCKNFDARILVSSVQRYGLLDKLKHKHCCFSDTLSVFREILPPRSSYSEENLVNDYLHTEYSAHNAKHD